MKTITPKVDALLQGARSAFADQDFDQFWADFRAAAEERKRKTKKLVSPRHIVGK